MLKREVNMQFWRCLGLGLVLGCLNFNPQLFAQTSIYSIIYRPAGIAYEVVKTVHFDVIYQAGFQEQALEAAYQLEVHYDSTRSLVGTSHRFRMPVVLNAFNDRSNGYVTPVPFKQEVELPRIRTDGLSLRSASWLETVMPHELVHAVQGEYRAGFGLGGLLRWFSPDLARAVNFGIPPGITEGWAVYYESSFRSGSGRLNHSIFNMEFRAAMLSDKPWSLAQMLEAPSYTYPFDRFYNGGGHWVEYLYANGYGRTIGRALQLQNRFPLWGYGMSWWLANRKEPVWYYNAFRDEIRATEQARLDDLGVLTDPTVVASKTGRIHRRPLWLDNEHVVVYARGYALRRGLYRIHTQTGERTLLSYQRVLGDWSYALSDDARRLYFARYDPDPLVGIQAEASSYVLDLAERTVEALGAGARHFAPVEGPDGVLWTLRNRGQFTEWYTHQADGTTIQVAPWERATIQALLPRPSSDATYVLMNVAGYQGLFSVSFAGQQVDGTIPVILFEEASVLQATWSRDGRYVLFSADLGGIPNVYAFDVESQAVRRLTNAAFGALDPALSPDQRTVAYIDYQHEQYNLVTIPFDWEAGVDVPVADWQGGFDSDWESQLMTPAIPLMAATEGPAKPYRAIRYIAPRSLFPTISYEDERTSNPDDVELGVAVGLALQGTDPLETWRYNVEGFYQHHRLWGRAAFQGAGNALRPTLSLFSEPSTVLALRTLPNGEVETLRVGREERGVGVRLETPITLEQNVFSSRVSLALRADYEEERLFDDNGDDLRDFIGRFTLRPAVQYSHRLQSNARDLVPNTGAVLTVNSLLDLSVEEGQARQAMLARATVYVPLLMQQNIGLALNAGLLTQNRGSIYTLDFFMPRGHEDVFLGQGTFVRYGAEVTVPISYIDNGFVLAPIYFRALYAFGFAESLHPSDDWSETERVSALGGGLGLQMRILSFASIDFRVAYSYRPHQGDGEIVFR